MTSSSPRGEGKAIRFQGDDVREFQSRASTGVRGMTLKDRATRSCRFRSSTARARRQEEREAYLRAAPWKDNDNEPVLPAERMLEMAGAEQFILTVCANGYGKRSSSFEYRRTNRGGQGITNIDNLERNGPVVASFPVHDGQQLMLVTDQAKLIRIGVHDLRVIGRNSAGVRLFDVAPGEHVVGAARIEESADDGSEPEAESAADDATPPEA